jgi:hypothetical protein
MAVEYWTNPDAIQALLPPGLTADPKSKGRAFFWFLDWQFTGSNDEVTDPARYQYREAFVLVDAVFDGKPVTYCPFIFVDNDAAIARGWSRAIRRSWAASTRRALFPRPAPTRRHWPREAASEQASPHMESAWRLRASSSKRKSRTLQPSSAAPRRCADTFHNWWPTAKTSRRSTSSLCR